MNSFELDGILEKKDVIRYTLASVPILDLTIRHMSVVPGSRIRQKTELFRGSGGSRSGC